MNQALPSHIRARAQGIIDFEILKNTLRETSIRDQTFEVNKQFIIWYCSKNDTNIVHIGARIGDFKQ